MKFYHQRQLLFINKASVAQSTLDNVDTHRFEVFILSFQNPFKSVTSFIPHTQPVSGKAGFIIEGRFSNSRISEKAEGNGLAGKPGLVTPA